MPDGGMLQLALLQTVMSCSYGLALLPRIAHKDLSTTRATSNNIDLPKIDR